MKWLVVVLGCALGGLGLMVGPAHGEPAVALVPIEGDASNKLAGIIADALTGSAQVVRAADTTKAIKKLKLRGKLDGGDVKKLRQRLKVDALVEGRVESRGGRQSLRLVVSARGREPDSFTLQYKSPRSEKFRDSVREQLLKRIDGSGDPDDDDDDARRRKAVAEREARETKEREDKERESREREDKERTSRAERERREREEREAREAREARSAEREDKGRKGRKVAARDDDDDGERKVRRKKRRDRDRDSDGGEVSERGEATPAKVWPGIELNVGLSAGIRRLNYKATGMMVPPRVGTGAPGGRIEGEVYPFVLAKSSGPITGLGFTGEYDKTLGLSIAVPGTNVDAPIDQAHYAIGVRYRLPLGSAALGFGLRYARRHYIADRSGLTAPGVLDTPDVDYTALSPGIGGRVMVTPKVAIFLGLDLLLVTNTGPIQEAGSYGKANVFGAEAEGGVDIALASRFALRLAAEYSQINFSFTGTNTMATARGVTGATDRTFGAAATLGVVY